MSDYGFSKLIELFEAVPGTIEVTEDPDGERLLQLTDCERLKVVGEHITNLIKMSNSSSITLDNLETLYSKQYGYQLRAENFGHNTIKSLLSKTNFIIRL